MNRVLVLTLLAIVLFIVFLAATAFNFARAAQVSGQAQAVQAVVQTHVVDEPAEPPVLPDVTSDLESVAPTKQAGVASTPAPTPQTTSEDAPNNLSFETARKLAQVSDEEWPIVEQMLISNGELSRAAIQLCDCSMMVSYFKPFTVFAVTNNYVKIRYGSWNKALEMLQTTGAW